MTARYSHNLKAHEDHPGRYSITVRSWWTLMDPSADLQVHLSVRQVDCLQPLQGTSGVSGHGATEESQTQHSS